MAIVRAVKTGNWSDTTVWNTGALPTVNDDVYSNTFTVTIDTSPTVLSCQSMATTGVTAGGSFVPTNGITLTCTGAGVVSGGSHCFVSNLTLGQSCTLVSNVTGPLSSSGFCGARNQSTGTMNIIGNCAVAGTGLGAENVSTGVLNITGSCTGGTGVSSHGAILSGNGQLNITGNCTGGSGTLAHGAFNNGTNGTLNVTGIVTAGTGGNGAINSSTSGTMSIAGACQASTSLPAIGGGSIGQITILSGPLLSTDASAGGAAASGVNPCVALRWFPADTSLSTFEYRVRGETVTGSPSARAARQLFLPEAYSATYPSATNVRLGSTYGPGGIYTGTCAIPPAGSVAFGVPVDNTTGTAAIDGPSIRAVLGMATANLDTQLSNLSSGQTTINNNVSTRLAAASYTTPPTAAANASAVRTELTTELSRIDTTVSSRLPTTSYSAPLNAAGTRTALGLANANLDNQFDNLPTASENASAVRTELAPELGRVSNCATVGTTGQQIQDALSS